MPSILPNSTFTWKQNQMTWKCHGTLSDFNTENFCFQFSRVYQNGKKTDFRPRKMKLFSSYSFFRISMEVYFAFSAVWNEDWSFENEKKKHNTIQEVKFGKNATNIKIWALRVIFSLFLYLFIYFVSVSFFLCEWIFFSLLPEAFFRVFNTGAWRCLRATSFATFIRCIFFFVVSFSCLVLLSSLFILSGVCFMYEPNWSCILHSRCVI